jgi:hypothetical protein
MMPAGGRASAQQQRDDQDNRLFSHALFRPSG